MHFYRNEWRTHLLPWRNLSPRSPPLGYYSYFLRLCHNARWISFLIGCHVQLPGHTTMRHLMWCFSGVLLRLLRRRKWPPQGQVFFSQTSHLNNDKKIQIIIIIIIMIIIMIFFKKISNKAIFAVSIGLTLLTIVLLHRWHWRALTNAFDQIHNTWKKCSF